MTKSGSDPRPLPVVPIQKKRVSEKIVQELKALLESGHLTPGCKLPPERELCVMLNVSRPSLREALRALGMIGVIENRQGDGTYLATSSSEWSGEALSMMLLIHKGALQDIFEARESLEVTAAKLAAQRRTPEDLKAMEAALETMRRKFNTTAAYIKADLNFHQTVVTATRNPVIIDLMNKLYKLLIPTRDLIYRHHQLTGLNVDRDFHFHESLFENIKSQDADAASQVMGAHMAHFKNRLLNAK